MTSVTETMAGAELPRCGCCGRQRPAGRVAELGVTPGVFICAGCALWAARRAGVLSAVRQVRLRSLLSRLRRGRAEPMVRAAVPTLPSADLGRTAAFYAPVGFVHAERQDGYLLLHGGGAELHFARQETVTPTGCVLQVADAAKLWKQLRDLGVDGAGPVAEQDYGLREFVLTDPDGNRIRISSPLP